VRRNEGQKLKPTDLDALQELEELLLVHGQLLHAVNHARNCSREEESMDEGWKNLFFSRRTPLGS
jgi:hypothetical protein